MALMRMTSGARCSTSSIPHRGYISLLIARNIVTAGQPNQVIRKAAFSHRDEGGFCHEKKDFRSGETLYPLDNAFAPLLHSLHDPGGFLLPVQDLPQMLDALQDPVDILRKDHIRRKAELVETVNDLSRVSNPRGNDQVRFQRDDLFKIGSDVAAHLGFSFSGLRIIPTVRRHPRSRYQGRG